MLRTAEISGTGCASDDVAASIEDLQFVLGEGPCVDAYDQALPVLEPDLVTPEDDRWPAFARGAVGAGARAVFGFPLLVGTSRVGALNLYRAEPGPLSEDQYEDALIAADVVARVLLGMQQNAPEGTVAPAIEAGGDLRYVVHQAAGMVAAQLGVSVAQAILRLRGFAFAADQPVTQVADDVVSRRLRFGGGFDEAESDN